MYTHPALLNPHLISCSLTGDSSNQAPPPWRTVKWFELEYVLTGEGGGFLKSCQPLRLMLEPLLQDSEQQGRLSYLALHVKNVCNFALCLRVRALIGLQPLALGAPLRSSIYPDGCMRGVPQKAGRLRLPPGFSGWVAFRPGKKGAEYDVQTRGIEIELLEPGGRSGAMMLLDRPFFSPNSRLCLPRKFFNITGENFSQFIKTPPEGVAVWLKQGQSKGSHESAWNGASINIAYNPRFQLARPGMVFFHKPGSRLRRINGYTGIKLIFDAFYDEFMAEEYRKRVFESAGQWHLERMAQKGRNFEALEKLNGALGGAQFEEKFRKIFDGFIQRGRSLELRARLLELIAQLPERGECSDFCIRIKERLDRDYNKNLSLLRLSEEEGVTPEHLCRSFKKAYGDSPVAYLVKVRLACARRLLLSTELSLNEIRDVCGFLSASYFYSVFKKNEGLAPGEYREVFAGR